jgi:glycosidase
MSDESDTPWLKWAVIYQVFIDRFFRAGGDLLTNNGTKPVFCGGNLQGVAEKMDYLSELGINTVWLSPFNKTAAYHGYHITDYFKVEERFGGRKGFRELVRAAGSHRIRLIMDFVPNHVSVEHPIFQKAIRNRRSPFGKWFYWNKDRSYLRYLGVAELAKVNLDSKPARKHFTNAAKHWIDEGIAGFRLDHALGPSLDFWREFTEAVRAYAPGTPLIGEILFAGIQRQHLSTIHLPDKHSYFLAHQLGFDVIDATMREYAFVFDGLLDFSFQRLLVKQLANRKPPTSRKRIQQLLDEHYGGFPEGCALLSFLDNHDMNRFLFEAKGNKSLLRQAAEIQFAQASPPVIYYGTEIGMNQIGPVAGQGGDIRARSAMAWDKPDRNLFKTYQGLIGRWKQRHGGA